MKFFNKTNQTKSSELVVSNHFVLLDFFNTTIHLPEQVIDVKWSIVDQSDARKRAFLADFAVAASSTLVGSSVTSILLSPQTILTHRSEEGSPKVLFIPM